MKLRKFRERVSAIGVTADQNGDIDGRVFQRVKNIFVEKMDNDLNVKGSFDGLYEFLSEVAVGEVKPSVASGIIKALRAIDEVLRVIF